MKNRFSMYIKSWTGLLVGLCTSTVVVSSSTVWAQETAPTVGFRSDVAPILVEKCVACHSAKKAEGGYRLDTYEELLKPGDSGENPVATKDSANSLLVHRVKDENAETRMPPEQPPLSENEIKILAAWIDSGATFDGEDSKQLLVLQTPAKTYPAPATSYPAIPLYAAALTKDGNLLLTGGYHEILIWNLQQKTLDSRVSNIGQRVFAIAINDQGDKAAVACGEPGRVGEVRIVDLATKQVSTVVTRSIDVALDVAFRPGTNELAVGFADNSIRIVNIDTNTITKTYTSHADWVTAIAFSPDGKRLASGSRDKSVKVLDLESGEMILNYSGHTAPVRGVAFSGDGTQVFSVADDKRLHRWNVADGDRAADVPLSGQGARIVRHGGHLFIPTSARQIHKLDVSNNQIVGTLSGHKDWVHATAVTPTDVVVSVSHDAEIKVWGPDGSSQATWLGVPQ